MLVALISTVSFLLVGIVFVCGAYLLPKGFGLASWRRQGSLIIGCALLMVSMLPLGLWEGRVAAEQRRGNAPRAPMAGDPSLPTNDPIAAGEYIVFATIRMDDAVNDRSCFTVIAPVYGNEVDADAMRIHMVTMDGLCAITDILGARWRLRVTPRTNGGSNFAALVPPSNTCNPTEEHGESFCPRDLAEFAHPSPRL